jgi:hypothetical protein
VAFGRPALVGLAVATLVVACQTSTTPSDDPGTTVLPAETIEQPGSVGPLPSPTQPDDTTPVVLDETLLGILPEAIDGIEMTYAPDEAAIALDDPALPRIATALDAGVAVDAARGNLVYALVVRLKPGTFSDAIFRQWRDSFTLGACAASGGPIGEAESTIDDRTVYITSCAAGLHTYHVWLQQQDVVISASSIGEARFGQQLMDNLRVPGTRAP